VTLSVRPNRDLQTVTGADLVQPWSRIREDLFASTYAQGVVELLARTFWRDHPGEDLFDLLVTILEALDDGGADPQLLFLCFGVQLAAALGYAVRLERCAGCGGELGPRVTFAVADGSVWCSGCYPPEGSIVRAGRETIRLLARLGSADGPAAAASLTPAGPVRREAERLVRKHLEYHTETDLDLRSLRLAESLRHRRFTGPQGREPEGEPRSPSRS